MTRSRSDEIMKEKHEDIVQLWRIMKDGLISPPRTESEWKDIANALSEYCGCNPFRLELAVSVYREFARLDGQDVTEDRRWWNG